MSNFIFLTSEATDTTAAATGGMGSMLLMLVLMFGLMYFLLIRPENKKKKEAEAMRNALKVGDHITTIGGFRGVVVHIEKDYVVMETGDDQVRVELTKWAISTNDTQDEKAKSDAKRAAEERAKAKAEKKANKGK